MSVYGPVSPNPLMYYQMLPYFYCSPNPNNGQPPEAEAMNHLRMSVLANQLAISQVNQVVEEILKMEEDGGTREPRQTQNTEFQRKLLENIVIGFKTIEKALKGFQNAQQPSQNFSEIETMLESQQKVLQDYFDNLAANTANISFIGDAVQTLSKSQEKDVEGLTSQLANLTALVTETRTDLTQLSQMVEESFKNLTRKEPEPLLCPVGFVHLDGECFYVSSEVLSWNEARKFCRLIDGELAVPREPLALILMLNTTNATDGYWIGGKRAPSEPFTAGRLDSDDGNEGASSWQWLSGSPVGHGWLSGRPTPTEGMTCLGVFGRGFANDNCNVKLKFVCELDEALLKDEP